MKQVFRRVTTGWATGLALAVVMGSVAGAQQAEHGRKWKPLPPLAHIVVKVLKGFDGKPMPNVAVVFHSTLEGRDNGNLEVKTDPEGKATIDAIEVGSDVDVQVIAHGFATYARQIGAVGANNIVTIKMLRPREQVSQYENTVGKAAVVRPGIQEPPHPVVVAPKPNQDGYAMPAPTPPPAQTAPQTSSPQ
ncbi:MAG: hypothetical protein WBY53_11770 [Acidobacteriaceae bacterium]